jgi:phosphopantetheinyl transferase
MKPATDEIHVWVIASQAGNPTARQAAGRKALETVVSAYAPDARVVFRAGRRPEITGSELHASLARADGLALIAVATGRDVGVDVEPVRPPPPRAVVAQLLTPREVQELDRTHADERDAAFARAWVRKEAVLKAVGVGLAIEPCLVEVGLTAVSPTFVAVPGRGEVTVSDVDVGGYVAAVAARGAVGFTVRCLEGVSAVRPVARRPARAVRALRP